MPLIAGVLFSQQDLTTDSWHWLGAADALRGPLVQINSLNGANVLLYLRWGPWTSDSFW